MTSKPDSSQFAFSPLFAHSRPSVTPAEIAKALSITDRQCRDLIDSGVFAAVPINDDPNSQRKHYRALRFTVEAWWLELYLRAHGEEYNWPNTAEIVAWRAKLRSRRDLPAATLPSAA